MSDIKESMDLCCDFSCPCCMGVLCPYQSWSGPRPLVSFTCFSIQGKDMARCWPFGERYGKVLAIKGKDMVRCWPLKGKIWQGAGH